VSVFIHWQIRRQIRNSNKGTTPRGQNIKWPKLIGKKIDILIYGVFKLKENYFFSCAPNKVTSDADSYSPFQNYTVKTDEFTSVIS
jgi:hypothetical protein